MVALQPAGAGLRSSVGTSPSRDSPSGGQGPVQLSSAPSSVITEPEKAEPSGEASSAISQPYSSTSPSRWSGTLSAARRHSSAGYLRSDSVANRPIATAQTETPLPAQFSASSRLSASTAA